MIYRIINDAPSSTDDFYSHNSISTAILKIINNSDGGKTIGLEGPWGSGKSSIINILEEKIKDDEYIFIYKFDAWTHQGEPLRRAFLEGLFTRILNAKWFEIGKTGVEAKKILKKESEKIAKKTKISEKESMPKINNFGRILILIFLLFPLAFPFITSAIMSQKNGDSAYFFKLYAGGTILILPFLALIGKILDTVISTRRKTKKEKEKEMQEVWAVFHQKNHVSEETTTTENVDASTIEFQKYFKDLMELSLDHPQKKLIIVIDNLDRISEKEVESAWPILRSFVDNPEFSSEQWFKDLWVIIPYAPNSLKNRISTKETATESKFSANGFLDKIIQINFPVPVPILSNLKEFIEKTLIYAFGEEFPAKQSHKIFILISNELNDGNEITPRVIISIINNMVATALQWEDVPIVCHAYFSILRRKYSLQEMEKALVNGELKIEKYSEILPESITLDLSVLICNVPEKIAAQKLYGSKIKSAIGDFNGVHKLNQDCQNIGYVDALAITLWDILDENISQPHKLMLNIDNLLSSDVISNMTVERQDHFMSDITKSLKMAAWMPLNSINFSRVIIFFSKNDENKSYKDLLIEAIYRTKKYFEDSMDGWHQPNFDSPSIIIKNLQTLRQSSAVQKYFLGEFKINNIIFPGTFENWSNICLSLFWLGEISTKGFLPKISVSEILIELNYNKHYDKPSGRFIAACCSLEENEIDIPPDIIAGFVERLNNPPLHTISDILYTIPFLIKKFSQSKVFENEIAIIDANRAYYFLGFLSSENIDISTVADVDGLKIEEIIDELLGNIICLWLIQGMPPLKIGHEGIFLIGEAFLKKIMTDHQEQKKIKRRVKKLLAPKEKLIEEIHKLSLKNKIATEFFESTFSL